MPYYNVVQHIEGLPKWYVGTSEKYDNLEKVDEKGIYFLTDTGNIMHNCENINTAIIVYEDGLRPLIGAEDRLYINSTTLEGYRFINDTWVQVIESIETAETIEAEEAIKLEKLNGFGVESIVNKFLDEMNRKSTTSIDWDENTHNLIYRLGESGHEVKIKGLVSHFTFDTKTRICTCYDDLGNVVCETELIDNHIIGGSYDDERKAIIFKMRNGQEVRLKASALLNMFHGARTRTMTSIVKNYVDGKNVLTGEVNISIRAQNKLTVMEDGLWAPKPKDIRDMEEGEMYMISGEYVIPAIKINLLATEEYVSQIKEELVQRILEKGANWLTKSKIIYSMNDIPSIEQVPAMKLINSHCGVKRLI